MDDTNVELQVVNVSVQCSRCGLIIMLDAVRSWKEITPTWISGSGFQSSNFVYAEIGKSAWRDTENEEQTDA